MAMAFRACATKRSREVEEAEEVEEVEEVKEVKEQDPDQLGAEDIVEEIDCEGGAEDVARATGAR